MKVSIKKGIPAGKFVAPPSKSFSHRALICSALARGESVLEGIYPSKDVVATVDCLKVLGASFDRDGLPPSFLRVVGFDPVCARASAPLPCGESGSTLRFMTAVALLSREPAVLTGTKRLLARPLSEYAAICEKQKLPFVSKEESLFVKGPLSSGDYEISAQVSSQFASGLMMTLPLLEGNSRIVFNGKVTSRSYMKMTLEVMAKFGVSAKFTDDSEILIPGGQKYTPRRYAVEGDYSGASFFAAMNAVGGKIDISGLVPDSVQGDRIYEKYFPLLEKEGAELDISDCPDLAPVLMALAAAKNRVKLLGTGRLAAKESDRGAAMAEELKKFGVRCDIAEDEITVYGGRLIPPTVPLTAHGDHRIVMACAVLLTLTGGEIEGAENASKSFPDFFERLAALGIEVTKE